MKKYHSLADRLLCNSTPIRGALDSDCWIWLARVDRGGYGRLNVRVNGAHKTVKAHRASFETFVGAIPDGMEINHKCRNTRCIAPDHLEPTEPEAHKRGGHYLCKRAN